MKKAIEIRGNWRIRRRREIKAKRMRKKKKMMMMTWYQLCYVAKKELDDRVLRKRPVDSAGST